MIDPTNITNYNLSDEDLERHILFWVCAAGKNGVTAAKAVDKFESLMRTFASIDPNITYAFPVHPDKDTLFELIHKMGFEELKGTMRNAGIGCFRLKARTFKMLAKSGLNLRTCTVDDLEDIKGIGPKTARCFLIHSRPNQKLAGLDRHILSFLRDKGYNVPKNTPTGNKYKQIEKIFLNEAEKFDKSIAELDLEIWNKYRGKK